MTVDKADKKLLIENLSALYFLQFASYFLPLITIPYLVRVLGPDKFGVISLAQVLNQCFVIVTDYGFNFSVPRKISVLGEDITGISRIFNSVFTIKTLLAVLSFFLLLILVYAIPKFREYRMVYIFTFGQVIGNVLLPVWFFQGMGRIKYAASLNMVAKSIFTIAIFIFIKRQSDYIYVPVINSLGALAAGILAITLIVKRFNITIKLPNIQEIIGEVSEGWHIFTVGVIYMAYSVAVPLILGFVAPYRIVGYYSGAEKIIKMAEQIQVPLLQALYPHVSKIKYRSRAAAVLFIRKVAKMLGAFDAALFLALFIFAGQISDIVLGRQFRESVCMIRIMSFIVFAHGMWHLFAEMMMNLGEDVNVMRITLCASIISISASLILIPAFSGKGAAVAALLPGIVLFVLSALFVERSDHLISVRS
jgi:PST family polysaccharide transporter